MSEHELPLECRRCGAPAVTSGSDGRFGDKINYRCGRWEGTTRDGASLREPIITYPCDYVKALREALKAAHGYMSDDFEYWESPMHRRVKELGCV
jgi:hypothetical protein